MDTVASTLSSDYHSRHRPPKRMIHSYEEEEELRPQVRPVYWPHQVIVYEEIATHRPVQRVYMEETLLM